MDRIVLMLQNGGKPTGPEFTYSGRPDSTYRKDEAGNWYVKNPGTKNQFVQIQDPTGKRSAILNSQAKVRSTTLRTAQDLAPTKNANANANRNVEAQYLEQLKKLENGIKKGYENGVWKPHASVEGGAPTIAYGHKLKPGEDYSKGITDKQAHDLMVSDFNKKKAVARRYVDSKYGSGTFDKLEPTKQVLLTDYEYNVGLHKFPSFVKGVVTNNRDMMLEEYKRYTGGNELTSRNNWSLGMINSLAKGGVIEPKNAREAQLLSNRRRLMGLLYKSK